MIAAIDPKQAWAFAEFERLRRENPQVVDEVLEFIAHRHHTMTVTLRFHGGVLQCADLNRVAKARP